MRTGSCARKALLPLPFGLLHRFRPLCCFGRLCLILLCSPVMFCAPDATQAELVRFEVLEIKSPYFDGRSFCPVGQYEIITARATIAVDPEHSLNACCSRMT